jgi:hypothetical protein
MLFFYYFVHIVMIFAAVFMIFMVSSVMQHAYLYPGLIEGVIDLVIAILSLCRLSIGRFFMLLNGIWGIGCVLTAINSPSAFLYHFLDLILWSCVFSIGWSSRWKNLYSKFGVFERFFRKSIM